MNLFNSKAILKEQRVLWIDYDKGISILLVGYGHSFAILYGHGVSFEAYPIFNYIGTFLYGFRMPLFFIISGLLVGKSLQKKGLRAYLFSRANHILHPLLIWGILEVTIKLVAGDGAGTDSYFKSYLNLLIDPRKTGVFWYLNALFFIGVLYAAIKSLLRLNPTKQLFIGFLFYCISAYVHVYDVDAGFLTDIMQYYIFFALGDLMSKIMFSKKMENWFLSAWVIAPLLSLFIITQFYLTKINLGAGEMIYIEHKMPFVFLIQALIGCALSISVSFSLQKYHLFSFLRVIGFHSLFIYCMQIIVMNFFRIFAYNILHISNPILLFFSTWFLGTMIPMLVYNVSINLNLWWLYTYSKAEKTPVHRAAKT